jgi:hypothetical protein
LPVGGTLVGRVLAPPAASFEHLSIELTRRFTGQETPGHAPYVRDGMEGLHENFLEEFEDYAAFSFGPVRAAQYDVWLSTGDFLLDSAGDSVRRQDGPRVHLGTVELAANVDTEAVFDARDHFPGWIDLDVSLADGSDAKLWIEARCSPPKADGRDRVSAQAPAGDRVLVGPLPAGEWSLLIRPLSKDWTWSSPAPIAVAPASLVPLHYDIDPDELR